MNENGYWVSFEFTNGFVGTWTDYAPSADVFIERLIKAKGDRIKSFMELRLDERNGRSLMPHYEEIDAKKYNQKLERQA